MNIYELFKYGTCWLRADFHLHTKSDQEFKFHGKDEEFIQKYIERLKQEDIKIAAITNHNKFQYEEFLKLQEIGLLEGIFFIPGVELSVNDGANGIHTLVLFHEEWIQNGKDYINKFLDITFPGKLPSEYQNENGRSSDNLIDTIKKLEQFQKDFFLIFAHVEQQSGLWKEIRGGRFIEIGHNEFFQRRTLGFQKVRTHSLQGRGTNRHKVLGWLHGWYPAEVEGSDCKNLDEIGKGKHCYLKLGTFSFEALKHALTDYESRVSFEKQEVKHSYIKKISFEGGLLSGTSIELSPHLNCIIGVRGSGKSTLLEALRYALHIPLGKKVQDRKYKEELVRFLLGSGGKIIIQAIDKTGRSFEIQRILDDVPDVYSEDTLLPNISIRNTILQKPLYFGQKELINSGDSFERYLVEKLIGDKLSHIRNLIQEQSKKIQDIVFRLKKHSDVQEKKKEYIAKIQDIEFRLFFFKDLGFYEKLGKQVEFEHSMRRCKQMTSASRQFLAEFSDFIELKKNDFNSYIDSFKEEEYFLEYLKSFNEFTIFLQKLEIEKPNIENIIKSLEQEERKLDRFKQNLKEEFAQKEREIEELITPFQKAARPDEYLQLHKKLSQYQISLEEIEKQELFKFKIQNELEQETIKLSGLWKEEYRIIQEELEHIHKHCPLVQINVEYKADKEAFLNTLKDTFKNCNLKERNFLDLISSFTDFHHMYQKISSCKEILESSYPLFINNFQEHLENLLTWQVPHKINVQYRGKQLQHHSLGQRASAMILLILSLHDTNLVIIDQPEDDLDNQTIYEDVIKNVQKLKPYTQFIFATHNANFPVLGDAEQVISCSFEHEKNNAFFIQTGSIDSTSTQEQIIHIMEGGKEAFQKRKNIYKIWKPHPQKR